MKTVKQSSVAPVSNTHLRILFLLPFAPNLDAVNGSGRVMAQLIQALAQHHEIAVLYLRGPDEKPLDPRINKQLFHAAGIPRTPRSRVTQRLRLLAGLLRRIPLWVSDWAVDSFGDELQTLLARWQPDIVQLEYHLMGRYLEKLETCPAPRVLVQHEPARRAAPYLRTRLPLVGALINRLDRRAWHHFEARIMKQVNAIVVFTAQDRQVVTPYTSGASVVQIPLGVPLTKPLNPLGGPRPNMLFIGNFEHAPNVDAALTLATDILPQVQTHCQDVHLYLVGASPPAQLQGLSAQNIHVTGYVPDVEPYLDQATVVVIPLRLGGGMRVKVLEALAAGKAIVASPRAIEGLPLTGGEQVAIADSTESFAAAVVDLLLNPQKRTQMASAAHRWAQANLSWQPSVSAYEALYAQLLNRPAPSPRAHSSDGVHRGTAPHA